MEFHTAGLVRAAALRRIALSFAKLGELADGGRDLILTRITDGKSRAIAV